MGKLKSRCNCQKGKQKLNISETLSEIFENILAIGISK